MNYLHPMTMNAVILLGALGLFHSAIWGNQSLESSEKNQPGKNKNVPHNTNIN